MDNQCLHAGCGCCGPTGRCYLGSLRAQVYYGNGSYRADCNNCFLRSGMELYGSFSLRFAQGLLVPFVFTAALAYITEEWSGVTATTMNGVYVAGTAFGGFCGRFLAGAAATFTGWLSTFLVFAVLLFLVLVLTMFCLPTERQFKPSASLAGSLKSIAKGVQDWRLQATCFIGASLLFQQVTSFTYLSLRLGAPPFSLTSLEVGSLFVVFLLPVTVTPFFGHLISKIGRTRAFCCLRLSGLRE